MLRNLKKQQKGFTIIEVMIVLVIAAVILLIVFLAVPALQRNSRNTQRKNDASKMTSVLQEVATNAGGTLPSGATTPALLANDTYSQYQASSINYDIITTGNATLPATVNNSTVIIRNNLKCSGNTTTGSGTAATTIGTGAGNIATTSGATYRTVVVIYAVELNGSNIQSQCIDT